MNCRWPNNLASFSQNWLYYQWKNFVVVDFSSSTIHKLLIKFRWLRSERDHNHKFWSIFHPNESVRRALLPRKSINQMNVTIIYGLCQFYDSAIDNFGHYAVIIWYTDRISSTTFYECRLDVALLFLLFLSSSSNVENEEWKIEHHAEIWESIMQHDSYGCCACFCVVAFSFGLPTFVSCNDYPKEMNKVEKTTRKASIFHFLFPISIGFQNPINTV